MDNITSENEDSKELSSKSIILLPLIERLEAIQEPVSNIEIAQGLVQDEKTYLLESTVTLLTESAVNHLVCLAGHLLRELLYRFVKKEYVSAQERSSSGQELYECA